MATKGWRQAQKPARLTQVRRQSRQRAAAQRNSQGHMLRPGPSTPGDHMYDLQGPGSALKLPLKSPNIAIDIPIVADTTLPTDSLVGLKLLEYCQGQATHYLKEPCKTVCVPFIICNLHSTPEKGGSEPGPAPSLGHAAITDAACETVMKDAGKVCCIPPRDQEHQDLRVTCIRHPGSEHASDPPGAL